MPCDLADDSSWPAFLAARTLLENGSRELCFGKRGRDWTCTADGPRDGVPTLRADFGARELALSPTGGPVDDAMASMARVYLPVLFLVAKALDEGRVAVVAHVTQTLDGRIACENGQSQWIGNDADLRHTHRMRALVDGVAIGAGTALTDDPRLTVRLVTGEHPRRIVLSGKGRVLHEHRALHVFADPGCVVVVGDGVEANGAPAAAQVVRVPQVGGDAPHPREVLKALHGLGIRSLYLEGGAGVLSSFLQAGCMDMLQVHIASMLLGSGLPSFRLPPVDHVRHGIEFAVDHAMLDGHVLLSCRPRPRTRRA